MKRAAIKAAQRLNDYQGKRMYRVPVRVDFNDSRRCATVAVLHLEVVARSAAAAANYMRDRYADRPETEVTAWGPKGGKAYRYIGYESAIWAAMMAPKGPEQGELL